MDKDTRVKAVEKDRESPRIGGKRQLASDRQTRACSFSFQVDSLINDKAAASRQSLGLGSGILNETHTPYYFFDTPLVDTSLVSLSLFTRPVKYLYNAFNT